jgi:hypothetical protein
MNNDFNPENPLAQFLYGSAEDKTRVWEELLDGSLPKLDISLAAEDAPLLSTGPGVCPDAGEWVSMVCGQADARLMEASVSHAAACDLCAARLRQAMTIFSSATTAEEDAMLASLSASTPAWQHRLAADLALSSRSALRFWPRGFTFWAETALAATLVTALSVSFWWHFHSSPEQQLAAASSHARFFELRLPGSAFSDVAPSSHMRGLQSAKESQELSEARARIASQLKEHPQDPHWLELQGRSDLIGEDFTSAINIFDGLIASGHVSTSLLVHDAAAYYERGTCAGSDSDRMIALERLRRAEELTPGDPVVLFNEAIMQEDCGQQINAVETWNRFLRFESDPRWLAEGHQRLLALELKLHSSSN